MLAATKRRARGGRGDPVAVSVLTRQRWPSRRQTMRNREEPGHWCPSAYRSTRGSGPGAPRHVPGSAKRRIRHPTSEAARARRCYVRTAQSGRATAEPPLDQASLSRWQPGVLGGRRGGARRMLLQPALTSAATWAIEITAQGEPTTSVKPQLLDKAPVRGDTSDARRACGMDEDEQRHCRRPY